MGGMKGRRKIDLSGLKCIVIDEADIFFTDERNFLQM
jgi:superfamily II DNA/RNA helicase